MRTLEYSRKSGFLIVTALSGEFIRRNPQQFFCTFVSFTFQASWTKKRRIASDTEAIVSTSSIIKNKNMFCWGSTVHGELGLGGIEDENILAPRELDFKKSTQIEHSKSIASFIQPNFF